MNILNILNKIEKDIQYHYSKMGEYPQESPDWNFHLGWVDALTSYRWQISEYIKSL